STAMTAMLARCPIEQTERSRVSKSAECFVQPLRVIAIRFDVEGALPGLTGAAFVRRNPNRIITIEGRRVPKAQSVRPRSYFVGYEQRTQSKAQTEHLAARDHLDVLRLRGPVLRF